MPVCLPAEGWGYRWMPVHSAASVTVGDLDSSPQACMAGTSATETAPKEVKILFVGWFVCFELK